MTLAEREAVRVRRFRWHVLAIVAVAVLAVTVAWAGIDYIWEVRMGR